MALSVHTAIYLSIICSLISISLQERVVIKPFGKILYKSWIHHTNYQVECQSSLRTTIYKKDAKIRWKTFALFVFWRSQYSCIFQWALVPWLLSPHSPWNCCLKFEPCFIIFLAEGLLHHLKWNYQLANLGIIHYGSDWVEAKLGLVTEI